MKFKKNLGIAALTGICLSLATYLPAQTYTQHKYFVAEPYVQLGHHFKGKDLSIVWLSEDDSNVLFEYRPAAEADWRAVSKIDHHAVNGHAGMHVYTAQMSELPPDSDINYRIKLNGKEIFQATTHSLPAPGNAARFGVFGDVGQGTEGEQKIADLLQRSKLPMVIVTGDIVYPIGTISHYLSNFFPYLNHPGGKAKGSPFMQSSLTVGVPGNHDIAEGGNVDARNLEAFPDSLAYYVLWKQPLNGPIEDKFGSNISKPYGNPLKLDEFFKAAGHSFPRMANFSFDYGDCHFLALDGNSYMDWTDAQLRKWVESDLSSTKARWKFVAFHQPGFSSDFAHREEQRMRRLSDIFERNGVDVVFSGHSHSYQRSYPIHFKAIDKNAEDRQAQLGAVYGTFKIDKRFDGEKNKKPDGIIYIVSGAGGARLSSPELESEPGHWLPFTKSFRCKEHSITVCQVDGKSFSLQQINSDGDVIDQFQIQK
ncbi:MAG: metallophosphoesterase [Candidatus Obscuribacterales bacterium]|nr:metallophosphoesterase [Candidatus Obscuribacterales bacterium]